MLFQTLDDKSACVGIYANNNLYFDEDEFPTNLSQTWSPVSYLRGLPIEYASLYLRGRSPKDHIPEYLQDDWGDALGKLEAFRRSLDISQVNTDENCFFDLVPTRFLAEFCEVKNKITQHILKTVPRPRRYEYYKHLSFLLKDIQDRPIKIDTRVARSYLEHPKLGRQAQKILKCSPYVKYNLFGTKTGRLTTLPNTFPILTLPSPLRSSVTPHNDCFLELDFNGAEVRTLLGLLGKKQPEGDVHQFHQEHVFDNKLTREQAKEAFFAWLYGARAAVKEGESQTLGSFYEKENLLKKFWINGDIQTPYHRHIAKVSKHHALNYLVQSTAAELCLKQALKIDHLLRTRSKGSYVAFLIHDAIVVDFKNEDKDLLNSMESLMQSTNFGSFVVNRKKGRTLGGLNVF